MAPTNTHLEFLEASMARLVELQAVSEERKRDYQDEFARLARETAALEEYLRDLEEQLRRKKREKRGASHQNPIDISGGSGSDEEDDMDVDMENLEKDLPHAIIVVREPEDLPAIIIDEPADVWSEDDAATDDAAAVVDQAQVTEVNTHVSELNDLAGLENEADALPIAESSVAGLNGTATNVRDTTPPQAQGMPQPIVQVGALHVGAAGEHEHWIGAVYHPHPRFQSSHIVRRDNQALRRRLEALHPQLPPHVEPGTHANIDWSMIDFDNEEL